MVDDTENGARIFIFTTEESLRRLAACEALFGDGTFKQAPKFFTQLYTIHGYFEGNMYPWIFAILPDKTERSYGRMLRLIKIELLKLGLDFKHTGEFQVDFEMAAIQAIKGVLNWQIKCCSFHYTVIAATIN